jgi:hypothetical protein
MRLSEAAEKLKRQAAVSVISGKENDARELLFQKKKVMHAIGRSKNRIELLDQLSSKLNQVLIYYFFNFIFGEPNLLFAKIYLISGNFCKRKPANRECGFRC